MVIRVLTAVIVLIMCSPMMALADDNPFKKSVVVKVGSESKWLIKEKTATRSGTDSSDFFHLTYDRKQLRLRITASAEDSEASARQYENFAVEDVRVDGKRLSLFRWCLKNQQKHNRFLQQGLKVKQGVCSNEGQRGTFIMRLNVATLEALKQGQTLSFIIKPFRASMTVSFDISDFSDVVAKLSGKTKSSQKMPQMATEMCKENPPKGFAKIKSIEYACKNAGAKNKAKASIKMMVAKERKRKNDNAAKNKAVENKLVGEQAAIAQTEASKQEMNEDITNKMLAICKKKWQTGEHRCYCEKFIKYAPPSIESDPSCLAE